MNSRTSQDASRPAIALEDAALVGVPGFFRVGCFVDNEGHRGTARRDFVRGQDNCPTMDRNADVLSRNCPGVT